MEEPHVLTARHDIEEPLFVEEQVVKPLFCTKEASVLLLWTSLILVTVGFVFVTNFFHF